jgi:hypothetical protein
MMQFVSLSGLSQDHHATLLEWADLWAAMDAKPSEWIPTTEGMYWQMLEVLPPRAQRGRAFLVGEANNTNADGYPVYACFNKLGDDYFARNLTLEQFKADILAG